MNHFDLFDDFDPNPILNPNLTLTPAGGYEK